MSALVSYSSDSESDKEPARKRRRVQLPSATSALPCVDEERRGVWPSLVFVKVRVLRSDGLREFLVQLDDTWQLTDEEDYHVSLSHTFELRKHQIEGYVAALRQQLRQLQPLSSASCAELRLCQTRVFSNPSETRDFAVVAHSRGIDTQGSDYESDDEETGELEVDDWLVQAVRLTDATLRKYEFAEFFQRPCWHLSVASRAKQGKVVLPKGSLDVRIQLQKEVILRIGNRLFSVAKLY
ncbi:MAG: hypothetical protein MHM6MM_001660 [Cercozoa sp. M6MM]